MLKWLKEHRSPKTDMPQAKRCSGNCNIAMPLNSNISSMQPIWVTQNASNKTNDKENLHQEKLTYRIPPISMLETSSVPDFSSVQQRLITNGQQLLQVLNSFDIPSKVVDISIGPSITRFELQLATGIRIRKIIELSNDIAMDLAVSDIHIEAPIPGKTTIGIEIPNKEKSIVRMRDLIESNVFVMAKSKLTVCLGRDMIGNPQIIDLSKMPHLLIAGTTGSGKSVCLNSLIISLLYKSTPKDVRFLMIDTTAIDFSTYNGIPQLLVPVVTDPYKVPAVLSWAVEETIKRYRLFANNNVRDWDSYNELASQNKTSIDYIPQIVILINDLADLMMAVPHEVEDSICRLAQMAHAAGIHLVIATQRPSVDVIAGLIKANIPGRIALTVASQIDSRIILDTDGAEHLHRNGDMLFSPTRVQNPIHIQGAFISDNEIAKVVNFIKRAAGPG